MAKPKLRAVFDTGPLIHLREIGLLKALAIFERVIVPREVASELGSDQSVMKKLKNITVEDMAAESKDLTGIVASQYNLDIGEAAAIATARRNGIRLFFTDDMDARDAAGHLGLEAHGTPAIVLRALINMVLSKEEAKAAMDDLHTKSSLYLTHDLVAFVKREIDRYKA